MEATNRTLATLLCAAAICVTASAQAQGNPELGDTGEGTWTPPPAAGGEATATGSFGASASADVDTSGDVDDSSPSSSPSGSGAHADAVGHFGIGFFGVVDLPICLNLNMGGGCDVNGGPNGALAAVATPAIGLRYWLSDSMAIEGALGVGYSSGTETVTAMNNNDENLDVSTLGILLHGAVPLALAYSGNFVFQLVPELNFGITSGTIYDNNAAMGMAPNDVDISGMLIQLGARAGAEIHFGFIGLPQLALQGTVGLHVSYASRTASISGLEVSRSNTNIGTSVQNDPWDLFTGNVTAIYYFID